MHEDSDQAENPFESLSFAPSWAKGSSDSQFEDIRRRAAKFESRGHDGGDRPRRDRGDEGRGFRRDARGGDFRGGRGGEFRRDRREGGGFHGGERVDRGDAPRRDFRRGDGRGDFRRGGESRPSFREPFVPPPFAVRFLPEQEALTFLARKIAASRKAMPLRDVADLFFKTPDTTLARLEMDESHKDEKFHQCAACGWFSRDEAELRRHVLAAHFAERFDAKTVDAEPPTGKFSSVARCGVTGKLLAPPNHHSYNRRIAEMLASPECAGLSEQEYRARIELVTDPEEIERWRAEAAKKTVYKLKTDGTGGSEAEAAPAATPPAEVPVAEAAPAVDAPVAAEASAADAPAAAEPAAAAGAADAAPAETSAPEAAPAAKTYTREEAEEKFLSEFAPKLFRHSRQVTIGHQASASIQDRQALDAIRRAWDTEQRLHVSSLFFAVRAGLKARKLALFRARDQRREEFVSFRNPTSIDASLAVPELRELLDWVAANPGATRAALVAELMPETIPPEKREALKTQLAFALDRGAIVEFANGTIALGATFAQPQRQA